ncbi:MAG: HlyC/CorC family transporter [Clostridia bacterium]|nr:HlyC/CorC family transporter [Clostridia bacterium]
MYDTIMIIAVALLVAFSAFFSSAETAVNSCSRPRLQNMLEKEIKGSDKALKFLDEYDKTITTLLIGNNIVNIAASSIAAILCTKIWGNYGAAISTGLLTLLILTFGEIIPKCYAKQNSELLLTRFSGAVYILMVLLTPLSLMFIKINSFALKITGSKDETPSFTEDELKYIIESSEEEGVLEEAESEMVQSALEFDEKTVLEILTPRVDVVFIDVNDDVDEIKKTISSERFSRIPVYEDNIDNIIGILYTRDYLEALTNGKTPNIRELMQPPYFVYKTRKLSALLADFKRKRIHIALVADEYGGILGIATMEDLLEELVGEIWDEDEEIEQQYKKLSDNCYEVSGDMQVEDLLELFEIPEKEVDTDSMSVGGWVFEKLGIIPKKNQTLELNGLQIKVAEIEDNRINKLIIKGHK